MGSVILSGSPSPRKIGRKGPEKENIGKFNSTQEEMLRYASPDTKAAAE